MTKFLNKTHTWQLDGSPGFRRHALGVNEFLTSPTSAFVLVLHSDGNLVLYGINDGAFVWANREPDSPEKLYSIGANQDYASVIWATDTDGSGADQAVMQSDGNLVLYRGENLPDNAVWSSNTFGNDNAYLIVQDDGNVVIYRAGAVAGTPGSALWSSNSYAGRR